MATNRGKGLIQDGAQKAVVYSLNVEPEKSRLKRTVVCRQQLSSFYVSFPERNVSVSMGERQKALLAHRQLCWKRRECP